MSDSDIEIQAFENTANNLKDALSVKLNKLDADDIVDIIQGYFGKRVPVEFGEHWRFESKDDLIILLLGQDDPEFIEYVSDQVEIYIANVLIEKYISEYLLSTEKITQERRLLDTQREEISALNKKLRQLSQRQKNINKTIDKTTITYTEYTALNDANLVNRMESNLKKIQDQNLQESRDPRWWSLLKLKVRILKGVSKRNETLEKLRAKSSELRKELESLGINIEQYMSGRSILEQQDSRRTPKTTPSRDDYNNKRKVSKLIKTISGKPKDKLINCISSFLNEYPSKRIVLDKQSLDTDMVAKLAVENDIESSVSKERLRTDKEYLRHTTDKLFKKLDSSKRYIIFGDKLIDLGKKRPPAKTFINSLRNEQEIEIKRGRAGLVDAEGERANKIMVSGQARKIARGYIHVHGDDIEVYNYFPSYALRVYKEMLINYKTLSQTNKNGMPKLKSMLYKKLEELNKYLNTKAVEEIKAVSTDTEQQSKERLSTINSLKNVGKNVKQDLEKTRVPTPQRDTRRQKLQHQRHPATKLVTPPAEIKYKAPREKISPATKDMRVHTSKCVVYPNSENDRARIQKIYNKVSSTKVKTLKSKQMIQTRSRRITLDNDNTNTKYPVYASPGSSGSIYITKLLPGIKRTRVICVGRSGKTGRKVMPLEYPDKYARIFTDKEVRTNSIDTKQIVQINFDLNAVKTSGESRQLYYPVHHYTNPTTKLSGYYLVYTVASNTKFRLGKEQFEPGTKVIFPRDSVPEIVAKVVVASTSSPDTTSLSQTEKPSNKIVRGDMFHMRKAMVSQCFQILTEEQIKALLVDYVSKSILGKNMKESLIGDINSKKSRRSLEFMVNNTKQFEGFINGIENVGACLPKK
jgi:hypothetical protein